MSFSLIINNAKGESGSIGHVEVLWIRIGMRNLECAVLPQGMSIAAMPLEATIRTISPCDLNAAAIVLHKKVFPVPP